MRLVSLSKYPVILTGLVWFDSIDYRFDLVDAIYSIYFKSPAPLLMVPP